MPANNQHLEELKAFIREHRSNESHFEKVYQRLQAEQAQAAQQSDSAAYAANLQEILNKQVPEYQTASEATGSAWPEYEKFITEWERAIAAASENAP